MKNKKSVFGSNARSMSCFTFEILNEFFVWRSKMVKRKFGSSRYFFTLSLSHSFSLLFAFSRRVNLRSDEICFAIGKHKGISVTNSWFSNWYAIRITLWIGLDWIEWRVYGFSLLFPFVLLVLCYICVRWFHFTKLWSSFFNTATTTTAMFFFRVQFIER